MKYEKKTTLSLFLPQRYVIMPLKILKMYERHDFLYERHDLAHERHFELIENHKKSI